MFRLIEIPKVCILVKAELTLSLLQQNYTLIILTAMHAVSLRVEETKLRSDINQVIQPDVSMQPY